MDDAAPDQRACAPAGTSPTSGWAQLIDDAEASWSGQFVIDRDVFVAYAAARISPDSDDLARIKQHGADLYLACACSVGNHGAIRELEAVLTSEVEVALRHLRLQPSVIDEVCQVVRERVIVGTPGQPPRITAYAGRGGLRGWMRVVATRVALNMLRDRARHVPLEEALVRASGSGADAGDPELVHLKNRYDTALRRALGRAMQALTAEDRVLLRERFVDGLTTTQMAALRRKHRITIMRRLNAVLHTIRTRTEQFLLCDVGCGQTTAASIVNMLLSQAHLSVQRHLAPVD